MAKARFTTRSLLIAIGMVCICLALIPWAYKEWLLSRIRYCADREDICGVSDVLRDAQALGFADDWADREFERTAKNGNWYILLGFGIHTDLSRPINGGRTALMHLAERGDAYAVKVLLDKNVDAEILDTSKFTAIDIARKNGHQTIASFIDVYMNDDWAQIKQAEELLMDLRSDNLHNELDKLLQLGKYAPIASSLIEMPTSLGDFSWFQITERVTMGIHNTDGMVFLTWLIDGHRIDDLS